MFNNTNNAEQSAKTPMRWTLKVYFKKWRKLLHDDQASADFSNAIRDGDLTSMKEMLEDPAIKAKINPSYQNEDGDTFLHLAVKQGRWDYVTPVNNLGCVGLWQARFRNLIINYWVCAIEQNSVAARELYAVLQSLSITVK